MARRAGSGHGLAAKQSPGADCHYRGGPCCSLPAAESVAESGVYWRLQQIYPALRAACYNRQRVLRCYKEFGLNDVIQHPGTLGRASIDLFTLSASVLLNTLATAAAVGPRRFVAVSVSTMIRLREALTRLTGRSGRLPEMLPA